jgi:hypothetical protein
MFDPVQVIRNSDSIYKTKIGRGPSLEADSSVEENAK